MARTLTREKRLREQSRVVRLEVRKLMAMQRELVVEVTLKDQLIHRLEVIREEMERAEILRVRRELGLAPPSHRPSLKPPSANVEDLGI